MSVKRISLISLVLVAAFGLSACSNMSPQAQRALSGGAIGAAGGAGLAYITGGPIVGAALVGGGAGAAVGALLPK